MLFRLGELFCGPGGIAWGALNADIGNSQYKIIHQWASDYDMNTCNTYIENICPDKKETVSLPTSNVLQFFLEGGTIVSARPSGTEPKIKFYINTKTEVGGAKCDGCLKATKEEASKLCDAIEKDINKILDDASK